MRYATYVKSFIGKAGVVSGNHFHIPGKAEKDVVASHKLMEVNEDFVLFKLPGAKSLSIPLGVLTIAAPMDGM